MPQVQIIFCSARQEVQNIGMADSNENYMVADVMCLVEGTQLKVRLQQPRGTNSDDWSMEVLLPAGLQDERLKHICRSNVFKDAAEKYLRSAFGSEASGFRIVGATNVRMSGNMVVRQQVVTIEVPEASAGGW